jgi:hypothetical protein
MATGPYKTCLSQAGEVVADVVLALSKRSCQLAHTVRAVAQDGQDACPDGVAHERASADGIARVGWRQLETEFGNNW